MRVVKPVLFICIICITNPTTAATNAAAVPRFTFALCFSVSSLKFKVSDPYLWSCASKRALSRLLLLHQHGVLISASRYDHGCEGVAAVDALVVHNVLRVVLAARVSGKVMKRFIWSAKWWRRENRWLTLCSFRTGPWTCCLLCRWWAAALLRSRFVFERCSPTSFVTE